MKRPLFPLGLVFALLLALLLATSAGPARAAVGATVITTSPDGERVTVLYPTLAVEAPVERGRFTFPLAVDAAPAANNGHLVVISHGSGGSVWVHEDLARALVEAGFVVAAPWHRGDNTADPAHPGPVSWTIRPAEVSRAIDAVAHDERFASLDFAHVGMYGMSAGGHTALSLAGGRWSPARFRDQCAERLAEDFQSCAGLATQLTGSWLDPIRRGAVLLAHRWLFSDDRLRDDRDARITAIVAAVPAAADFDPASLATPPVPLGIITARRDQWLVPRFHAERILGVCASCERLADIDGGHGALVSPLPPGIPGLEGRLLNDPPGFDRPAATATVDAAVVGFMRRHLLDQSGATGIVTSHSNAPVSSSKRASAG